MGLTLWSHWVLILVNWGNWGASRERRLRVRRVRGPRQLGGYQKENRCIYHLIAIIPDYLYLGKGKVIKILLLSIIL